MLNVNAGMVCVTGGGRISVTKVPSFQDETVRLAKQTPGAGAYNTRKDEVELPDGGRFGLGALSGWTFWGRTHG